MLRRKLCDDDNNDPDSGNNSDMIRRGNFTLTKRLAVTIREIVKKTYKNIRKTVSTIKITKKTAALLHCRCHLESAYVCAY